MKYTYKNGVVVVTQDGHMHEYKIHALVLSVLHSRGETDKGRTLALAAGYKP